MEDYLVEVKSKEIEHRDTKNEKRAKATKTAFVLLVAGVLTALLVAGLNAAALRGDTIHGELNPTRTPAATGTP